MAPDRPVSDAAPDATTPPDAAPLIADPGPAQRVDVGAEVVLDGRASTGAVRYQWDFGDGTGQAEPSPDPVARTVYRSPGRYHAVLTVFDAAGRRHAATALVTATHPPAEVAPVSSGSVARGVFADGVLRFAVVVPDADLLVVLRATGDATVPFAVERRVPVGDEPRTVTALSDGFAVACRGADRIDLVRGDDVQSLALPAAGRPFGVVGRPGAAHVFVTLSARGSLARVPLDTTAPTELFGFPDARGLAWTDEHTVFVSRWRSRDGRGLVWRVDTRENDSHEVELAFDPQRASDTEIGGVPNLLDALVASPQGTELAVPSLQANTGGGLFRDGRPLGHQTAIRAVVSFLDLGPDAAEERFEARKQFDNRGYAHGAVYSARGDHLFVAMPGAQTVERLDRLDGSPSGTIVQVGAHVTGLSVTPDDRYLLADASLDRTLVVYDVTDFERRPEPVQRLALLEEGAEPLSPAVLQGKRLFHDAADPRISRDGYIACAHCHPDGEDDGLTWDFTDRGEGLRNTIPLVGRAGDGHGPIHWSGNFDEIQDFEHDIRNAFGGTGLLPDDVFHGQGRDRPLGGSKAGAGEDLDALAAYVGTLETWPRSPHRHPDGSLPEGAQRGRELFRSEETGCLECHVGAALTDSVFLDTPPGEDRMPRLHDVGTLGPGSGGRLGGPLPGLDTPTLHGLWDSGPYLHDGSAVTLHDVLAARNAGDLHGTTSHLSSNQIDDLVDYLRCLDGRTE